MYKQVHKVWVSSFCGLPQSFVPRGAQHREQQLKAVRATGA